MPAKRAHVEPPLRAPDVRQTFGFAATEFLRRRLPPPVGARVEPSLVADRSDCSASESLRLDVHVRSDELSRAKIIERLSTSRSADDAECPRM